uniref:THAP domain-containing protein 1 n=1 Tax=Sinocyclocheilus grahami TaxID=75366 RepID=A0A672L426_SINGR
MIIYHLYHLYHFLPLIHHHVQLSLGACTASGARGVYALWHSLCNFHVFPTSEPARLKLWLIALWLDINTPINALKLLRVCSDHFSPDDFTYPGEHHVRLKPSAVPMVFPHPTEPAEHESDEGQETECLGADIGLKDVPQSTPQKPMKTGDEPAASESEPDDLNISMLSLDPPSEKKDVSFVPPSSTSASSTTTTTEEEEEQPWQERKWIVNESALMKQF